MKLSVCLITYNHEAYISEAIESVLNQVNELDWELVIAEDYSTDRTREICEQIVTSRPDRIRLLPKQSNLGMMKNFLRCLNECTGEYIAFIEGDDYWTDPTKLEKQVAFLDQNPDFSLCFHNALVKSDKKGIEGEWMFIPAPLPGDVLSTEDLLCQWFIPSASVVFRKYSDLHIPDWFVHCKSGDIPFLLLLSLRGKFKYMDQVMSVYRVHDKGVASSHIGYDKIALMVFIYENFNVYTNYKYKQKIRDAIVYEIDYHYPHKFPVLPKTLGRREVSLPARVFAKMKEIFSGN